MIVTPLCELLLCGRETENGLNLQSNNAALFLQCIFFLIGLSLFLLLLLQYDSLFIDQSFN